MRVRRGSSCTVHIVSLVEACSTFMVRSLYITKSFPLSPTRSCRNKTGPREESLISKASASMRGPVKIMAQDEKTTSKARFDKA